MRNRIELVSPLTGGTVSVSSGAEGPFIARGWEKVEPADDKKAPAKKAAVKSDKK